MEPASSIIQKLGGEAVVAEITATAYTAPYRWQYPVEKKGTGGRIPQRHHPALLDYARKKGIKLSADEFVMPVRLQPQRRARSKAA
jgi:putative alpha-1,2-mannosidase